MEVTELKFSRVCQWVLSYILWCLIFNARSREIKDSIDTETVTAAMYGQKATHRDDVRRQRRACGVHHSDLAMCSL